MSSETTYTVEVAKSGRSKCKKCKEPIPKETMRIGCHKPHEGGYDYTGWHHAGCFRLPRKYSSGAGKISVEDFCRDVLEDPNGGILDDEEKTNELIKAIEEGASNKRKSTGSGVMDEIKAAYEAEQKEIEEGKKPAAKKQKTGISSETLNAYAKYKSAKNDELSDMLGWNHQIKKGNKQLMLAKVVDGVVLGRLSRCELCGGVLKMTEDTKGIVCNGTFDEEAQRRIPCSFSCLPKDAPRWLPWYEEEPTEEEEEAMREVIEEYKEAGGKPVGGAGKKGDDGELSKLIAAAEEIDPFDLSSSNGVKAAVPAFQDILTKSEKKVDLPKNAKQARSEVLEIVMGNRDEDAAAIMKKLIKKFGFSEDKAAKKEQKVAALESNVACPANAPIVAVIDELSELYFKAGNRNAGGTYSKATKALREATFVITADNAMDMHKKNSPHKVNGIGKGTAEKIKEFLTTGQIQKLEEKRAEVA